MSANHSHDVDQSVQLIQSFQPAMSSGGTCTRSSPHISWRASLPYCPTCDQLWHSSVDVGCPCHRIVHTYFLQ